MYTTNCMCYEEVIVLCVPSIITYPTLDNDTCTRMFYYIVLAGTYDIPPGLVMNTYMSDLH